MSTSRTSSTSYYTKIMENMSTSYQSYQLQRKKLLDNYKIKQNFKVAIGKSQWLSYETFNPDYNLRQILDDEVVIEFDTDNKKLALEAIDLTAFNLYKAGICFEIWSHNGKSCHLHVHNLPIADLSAEKRRLFKKIFIRKYVPVEYLPYVDISLTGIHLIAIEWQFHWKGCYGVKELLYEFNPLEVKNEKT